MNGWKALIRASVRLARHNGTRLRRERGEYGLRLAPAGAVEPPATPSVLYLSGQPEDYVRGIATAAWRLSLEICEACGGPGDPTTRADGRRATLCAHHRESGDVELARGPWREPGDTDRSDGRLEQVAGSEELAAIMEAHSAPEDHRGWPLVRAAGDPEAETLHAIGATGWTHLFRAGFAALLPLENAGAERPWRLAKAKERLGRIRIHSRPVTPLHTGIEELLAAVSATTCIFCGRPGTMRVRGWTHPACSKCHRAGRERVYGQ